MSCLARRAVGCGGVDNRSLTAICAICRHQPLASALPRRAAATGLRAAEAEAAGDRRGPTDPAWAWACVQAGWQEREVQRDTEAEKTRARLERELQAPTAGVICILYATRAQRRFGRLCGAWRTADSTSMAWRHGQVVLNCEFRARRAH